MDKQDRRAHFHNKETHHQHEKKERIGKQIHSKEVMEQLNFQSLSDLIQFLQEKYDLVTKKNQEAMPKMNKRILNEMNRFRDEWSQSYKNDMHAYLASNELEMDDKTYKSIMDKNANIHKGNRGIFRSNIGNIPCVSVWISDTNGGKNKQQAKHFVAGQYVQGIQFDLSNKRFKKDALESCYRFQKIKQEASKI